MNATLAPHTENKPNRQEHVRIHPLSSVHIQHGTAVACLKIFVHRSYGITRLANELQMNEEISYRLFRLIEENPDISQRELAKAMGISLGKANYCLKALMDKGWLKARNFKNSNNKIAYAYVLTPSGLGAKAKITARYLKNKVHEYETLKSEIEKLRQEASDDS